MAISLADLEIIPFDSKEHDVSVFDCGDEDLNDFLKSDAAKTKSAPIFPVHNLTFGLVSKRSAVCPE
jgi:hypothetical protein